MIYKSARNWAACAAALSFALLSGATSSAATINVPPDPAPQAVGAGDTLNLLNNGVLDEIIVARSGSVLNIFGGEIRNQLNGALFGLAGSEINFHAGDLGTTEYGSFGVFNLMGGAPGDFAFFSGDINISGGDSGRNATIDGVVNLHGGLLQNNFLGLAGGQLNIFGRSLLIDGVPATGLTPGAPTIISQRGVTLTGDFFDRSSFELDLVLAPGGVLTPGFVADGFEVTFTLLVPEPSSALLALTAIGAAATMCGGRRSDGHRGVY